MINLTKWKVSKDGHELFLIENMGMPSDYNKGSMFHFDIPNDNNPFRLGDNIDIALPVGMPVYHCYVVGLSQNPTALNKLQVRANIESVQSQ